VPVDLAFLLPPGLDPLTALMFLALSMVASFITATFSLGGGVLMLAVLALVFPPTVVLPIHGAVQVGSNFGRAVMLWSHVVWSSVGWLALGFAFGTLLGAPVAAMLPADIFQIVIALFILITTWLPNPKVTDHSPTKQVVGGTVISALGMLVGATGPLVALFLRGLPDRQALVGTHALVMSIQNILKIGGFIALGFAFASYLPFVLAMVGCGLVGTALGGRFLMRVSDRVFRVGFRLMLTVMALYLLVRALANL
jgi:uncharacterized membrane protein YfcA